MGRHREFDPEEALDAAVLVFWQKGYEGTSYDDLTRVTGVARPGLYSAFGNKEALFRRAVDRYASRYLTFIDAALERPTARDVVHHFLDGVVNLATSMPDSLGCLGVNGAVACSEASDPIRRLLVEGRATTEARVRGRLERALAEGDLPVGANCAVLAGYVATISQGLAVQSKAGVPSDMLRAVVRHVVEAWPPGSCAPAETRQAASRRLKKARSCRQ